MEKKVNKNKRGLSRRDFIKTSAAAVSLAALAPGSRYAYAGGSDKIRVGLIGCGNRGTRAGISDCAESSKGIELVAMGDLFQDRVDEAPKKIKERMLEKKLPFDQIYKVTPETTFVGFDAYKKVIACDVDMVILTTPPHFRPIHLKAAIEAGKHAFIEKPAAVDPVGVRSLIASSELAKQKGLSIVAGTQSRHSLREKAIMKRIHDGAIGKVVAGQCYRLGDELWHHERQPSWSDMEYQVRNWLYYVWLSGDFVAEMHIHQLDKMNWAIGSHPIKVAGIGGRQVRTDPKFGNVYDTLGAEIEYPNDVRISYMGRQIDGCGYRTSTRIVGTKGWSLLGRKIEGENPYEYEGDLTNPAVQEFTDMVDGIRSGEPLNEGKRVAESSLTTIMVRMSGYTGREISWNWAMNASKLDLSPPKYEFCDLPVRPVAMPGITKLI